MAKRGCGYRSPGGLYLRVIVSPHGTKPVESCLVDPPIPVNPALGIPNRGVLILERNDRSGIWDVYDRIGSKHYPNVADFIEETKKLGVSRRVKRDTRNLDKLTTKSRIFLIHERAIITNHNDYYSAMLREQKEMALPATWFCRKCKENHRALDTMDQMCVSLYWEDIQGGELAYDPDLPVRSVYREIGERHYVARKRPDGVKPHYQEGIFFNLPLHCLDVIRDPEGHQDAKAMESASKTGLPVHLENS